MLIYVSYVHPTRIILFTEGCAVEVILGDVSVAQKSSWNLRAPLRDWSDNEQVSFLRPMHSSKEPSEPILHPDDDLYFFSFNF